MVRTKRLAAPVFAGTEASSLTLSWAAVPGAKGYRLRFRQEGAPEWIRVEALISGTKVKKNNLERGRPYLFQVLPEVDGEQWVWSQTSSSLTPGVTVHPPTSKKRPREEDQDLEQKKKKEEEEVEESDDDEDEDEDAFMPPSCWDLCQTEAMRTFALTRNQLINSGIDVEERENPQHPSWASMKLYRVDQCHALARAVHGGDCGIARALLFQSPSKKKYVWHDPR